MPETRVVEFPCEGTVLRGVLYRHDPAPGPILLMAHGFSATITGMVAERYAEVIHAAGIDVLLFDHQGFGLSGGEPRQVINRWLQGRGYRAALDFAAGLPGIDATRMALWGDSASSVAVISLAAFDGRVAAFVVQVPACGSEPPPPDPDGSLYRSLRESFLTADIVSNPKATRGPMPVVSDDQAANPSLLKPITAYRWFIEYGSRPGTGWLNHATSVVPDTAVPLHPGLCAPHFNGASLWVIARDDEMPGSEPEVSHLCYEAAGGDKELLDIEGGHFGLLYDRSPLFDTVSAAQADFLVRRLGN
ncbi:MAG: hypothetical protein KDJ88_12870 [Bauldia sp.]|nr:hypothetical protein [Bauldia sp.]